jgi:tetratricopeptide (TPR) repeat protein
MLKSNPLSVLFSYLLCLAGFYARLRKKHLLALAFYQKAIKLNPQSTGAYYASGLCHKVLQNNELALAEFKHAFLLNPKFSSSSTNHRDFFFHRGWVYYNLKNYRYAVIDFSRALEIRPGGVGNYGGRASAYYQLKEYQLALEDCNSAIKGNYKVVFVYGIRGQLNFRFLHYQQAIEDSNEMLSLEPHNLSGYFIRGVSYYRLRNYRQAIEDYNQIIAFNPPARTKTRVYYNRSMFYLGLGDIPKAKADCERSLEFEPKYIPVAWTLAWIEMQGQCPNQTIIKRLERIAANQIVQPDEQEDTDRYFASISRAVALGLKGKWDVARLELERAITQDPEQWDGYFWLSMALGYLGEPGDVEALEKGFEKDLPVVLLFPLAWLQQDRPGTSVWVDKYLNLENGLLTSVVQG